MHEHTKSGVVAMGTQTYTSTLSHSLIAHAEKDAAFTSWLTYLIQSQALPKTSPTSPCSRETMVTFLDSEQAARKAVWLIDALSEKRLPGYEDSVGTLTSWAKEQISEEPKAVILGLQGGVLNFGIWGHPKRRYEPMGVLLREDVAEKELSGETIGSIATLTHSIVEQGLLAAQGSTKKLEPELGDWLFGEKSVALYRASQETLASIEAEVVGLGVPHAVHRDIKGVSVMALTPALHVLDLRDADRLETLEEGKN